MHVHLFDVFGDQFFRYWDAPQDGILARWHTPALSQRRPRSHEREGSMCCTPAAGGPGIAARDAVLPPGTWPVLQCVLSPPVHEPEVLSTAQNKTKNGLS